MADDKLKQEFFYMASLTAKYDFHKMEVVEGILRLENERRILDSVFGRRFKTRIFDIAADVAIDDKCVLCGQPAENHVICNHCMETILGSDYAKSKIKIKEKKFELPDFKKAFENLKFPDFKKAFENIKLPKLGRVFQYCALVCLILILFLWHTNCHLQAL